MKVREMKPDHKVPVAKLTIKGIEEPKTFKGLECQECMAFDETGDIVLVLWNEDVDKFKKNDIVVIRDGWCKKFKSEKEVSAGKFGTIRKVEN